MTKKLVALFLTFVMVLGMIPIGPLAPKIAEAQMSHLQKTSANFIDVQIGSFHCAALDDEGRVYTWCATQGTDSGLYNLGRPTSNYNRCTQVAIAYENGAQVPMPWIKKISTALWGTVALDGSGNIWSWGNYHVTAAHRATALGHAYIEYNSRMNYPMKVTMPPGVTAVDVAASHTGGRFIGSDGGLYVWGTGSNSQEGGGNGYILGTGTSTMAATPIRLTLGENGASLLSERFVQVSSSNTWGNNCSIALTEDGKVYTWGNTSGSSDTVITEAGGSLRPRLVPLPAGMGDVVKVDANNGGWGILDNLGQLWLWGRNGLFRSGSGNFYYNINSTETPGTTGRSSSMPQLVTQVFSRGTTSATNREVWVAPKWQQFSMYSWGILALDEQGRVFAGGHSNNGGQNGSPANVANTLNRLAYFRPGIVPDDVTIHTVSAGWRGCAFTDEYGNCYVNTSTGGYDYSSGGRTRNEPWVHVVNDFTPLFTNISVNPDEKVKRYNDALANLTATISGPVSDRVQYVILRADDTAPYVFENRNYYDGIRPWSVPGGPGSETYGVGETYYSLSFFDLDPPYFVDGSGQKILGSPNATAASSRYYANPVITEYMFNEAWNKKQAVGEAGFLDASFSLRDIIPEHSVIWLQVRNGVHTNRMIVPFDNVYTDSMYVYVKGVLSGTGKEIYPPQPVPGNQVARSGFNLSTNIYGLPLTRDKLDIVYKKELGQVPPMGWDIVQPSLVTNPTVFPGASFYELDPPNQTGLESLRDWYGINHRLLMPDGYRREIVLDDYRYYTYRSAPTTIAPTATDPEGFTNITAFTYKKRPELWENIRFHYVYENATDVTVVPPNTNPELLEQRIPVGGSTSLIEPFYPPDSVINSDVPVGYRIGSFNAGDTYIETIFPDGFNPVVTKTPTGTDIYIIYKGGKKIVSETFYEVKGHKVTNGVVTPADKKEPIENNAGFKEIRKGYDEDDDVTCDGQNINNQILSGFELWRENASGVMVHEKTVAFDWKTNANPFLSGSYEWISAEIEKIDADWQIHWLYYPGIIVPDEYKATINVYWRGMTSIVYGILLNSETVVDLAGAEKVFDEDRFTYIKDPYDPNQWALSPQEKYDTYTPKGDKSPAEVTLIADSDGGNSDINFWYNADINENGIIDEDEYITIKHRIYGDDANEIIDGKGDKVADIDIKPFLLGNEYIGFPTDIEGYYPVGWCVGEYNADMDDEDLNLIDTMADILGICFETDLTSNGQVMTIIYRKIAGKMTINYRGETWAGTVVPSTPQEIFGLEGEDVTWQLVDPFKDDLLWILDTANSTLPPGDPLKFVMTEAPQEYTFVYKENLTLAVITVQGKSTDDKLNIEKTIKEIPTGGKMTVKADVIPNYKVTGWKLYDSDGVEAGSGSGDEVEVTLIKGAQKIVFTYECLDTVVYVRAVDKDGNLLASQYFYDAILDGVYSVRALYVPGYALDDALIKVIDPVLEGTNIVEFKYELRQNVVIEFYEVGESMPIKVMNVKENPLDPLPRTYTAAKLEDELKDAYYIFNEEETLDNGTVVPFTVTELLTEQVFKVYFDKKTVPVRIALKDIDSGDIKEWIDDFFTDEENWLRANEMATFTAKAMLGYVITEPYSKTVLVDPNSTVLTPQVVTFEYRKSQLGDVTVLFYYDGDEINNKLEEYTINAEIGSTFSVTATDSYPGFELIDLEPTKSILVAATNPVMKFEYKEKKADITVKLVNVLDPTDVLLPGLYPMTMTVRAGVDVLIEPPAVTGYVLQEPYSYNRAYTDGEELVFNYTKINEMLVNIIVRGIDKATGKNIYSHVVSVPRDDTGTVSITAFDVLGYDLLSSTPSPVVVPTDGSRAEVVFEYSSKETYVIIKAVLDSDGSPVPEFSDIYIPAQLDQPIIYNAPYIPGYTLVGSLTERINFVSATNRTIIFRYAKAEGNVTILLKETNSEGKVIKVLTDTLAVDVPKSYNIMDYNLATDNYNYNGLPQIRNVIGSNTNTIIEFYYTKQARALEAQLLDVTGGGSALLGTISMGNFPIGELVQINAPAAPAGRNDLKLIGANPIYVIIGSDSGTQTAQLKYEQPASDEVVVNAVEASSGNLLYSHTMKAVSGTSVTVNAPNPSGWKLISSQPAAATQVVPGVVTFLYEEDPDAYANVHYVLKDTDSNPITAPPYITLDYKVLKGTNYTAYAPHISGYVLVGSQSQLLQNLAGNQDVTFIYQPVGSLMVTHIIRGIQVDSGGATIGGELYNYSFKVLKETGTTTYKAAELPGYLVSGASTVTLSNNASDIHTFSYSQSLGEVRVIATDMAGDILPGFTPIGFNNVVIGKIFNAIAPHVSGWVLEDSEPLYSGITVSANPADNDITFKYVAAGNVRLVLKETGSDNVIKQINVPGPQVFNSAPALQHFTFDPAATTITFPLNITSVAAPAEYVIYYTKDLRDVVVKAVNNTTGTEIDVAYRQNLAGRIGEMIYLTALNVPGFTLAEPPAKWVDVPNAAAPLDITFEYEEDAVATVKVTAFWNDGGVERIIQQYSFAGKVDSKARADAFDDLVGWELKAGEPSSKEIVVTAGTNEIKFEYVKNVATITVKAIHLSSLDEIVLDPEVTYEVPKGVDVTIYAPHISGYVVTNDDSLKLNVNKDEVIYFFYKTLEEEYDEYYVPILIKGVDSLGAELYSYTKRIAKDLIPTYTLTYGVEVFAQRGYDLDPGQDFKLYPGKYNYIFTYTSTATTVRITLLEEGSNKDLGSFSVPATIGEAFVYRAPNVPGYKVISNPPVVTVDPVLPDGASEIVFKYVMISSKVSIVYREENEYGPVIRVVEIEEPEVNEWVEVETPDLGHPEYYTRLQDSVSYYFNGSDIVEINAYYRKNLVSVDVHKVDYLTKDPIEAKGTVDNLRQGEVATITAPSVLGGWVVVGSTTQTIVANTGVSVTFSYRSQAIDEVQVKAVAKDSGKVLQSYSMTGTVGGMITVKAPDILGWKLAPGIANPQTAEVGRDKEIIFEYEKDVVTIKVSTKHFETKADIQVATDVEVAVTGSITIYAPHISGYVVYGAVSKSWDNIVANDSVEFLYRTLEEEFDDLFVPITIVGVDSRDHSRVLYSYTKRIPKAEIPCYLDENLDLFAVPYYSLDPDQDYYIPAKGTYTFTYTSTSGTVQITIKDEATDETISTYPVPAVVGEPFTYPPPDVPGYRYISVSPEYGKIDKVLPDGASEIIFTYAKIKSMVTIRCKEEGTDLVIRMVEIEEPVENAETTVKAPDLSDIFYEPVEEFVKYIFDGTNAVVVDAYYIKKLVSVTVKMIDYNTKLEIAAPITVPGLRQGEVAQIDAPDLIGINYVVVGPTKLA
ncbi:MAG: hypothetical protein FWF85_05165, partial [Clostridiales bacterium]|nr:hypothetical protein [Clostridiales bacterium]